MCAVELIRNCGTVPGPQDVTLLRDGEIRQGVWAAQTHGFYVLLGPFGPLSAVTTASEVVAPNVPLLKPLHVLRLFLVASASQAALNI